jgi:hypothetical protein
VCGFNWRKMGPRTLARAALLWAIGVSLAFGQDALPSWNDGPAKAAIASFVSRVTKEGGADFVPPAERLDRRRYEAGLETRLPV